MTLEEIKHQYPDEWVLIEFTKLDEGLEVIAGEVIVHSPNKEEINKKLVELENEKIAIEFTGTMPHEPAYLLQAGNDSDLKLTLDKLVMIERA